MARGIVTALLMALLPAAAPAAKWPACAVRAGTSGAPAIVINGKPHAPIMTSLNNQFGRDDVLLAELRQAAAAGLNLFSINLALDWYETPESAAKTLDAFCQADPNGYFYLRIWLGANPEWTAAHPGECITKADGSRLSLASPSSEIWREDAARMLRARLREIVHGPHADRFLGVCLTYLQTGEWFYTDTNDFMDYSPANLAAFRKWLKKKYRKDAALREAWNAPEAAIATAEFSSPEERDRAEWGIFRNPNRQRRAMDMQQFQNELIADTIAHFAAIVKEATQGRSLVGAFYGYTMELNGNGPRALAHSGHLALGRLLECRDIDLIHAPFSYFERKLGEPGHLHLPADSLALHGKLGILEEDTFTHLAHEPEPQLMAPGWNERTRTIDETLAVARRHFALAFTHQCGMWFFDLLSDGRWSDPKFWDSAPLFRRMAAELRGEPPFLPQVAFAVNEEAVHLLSATTHPFLLHSIYYWRSELDRIGAPVGYYLQSDLPRLPISVKLLILPNAFTLSRAERKAVEALLKRGGTILWNFAPDLAGPGGLDPARVSAVTGIQVEAIRDEVPRTIVCEVSGEMRAFDGLRWQPRFRVTSEDVHVLARYQETQEPSAAAKPLGNGVSVYTATPRLPVGLLRWICERSGVHLYRNTPGMTGIVGKYLVIHTAEAGPHELRLPAPCAIVERLVPYTALPVARETDRWTDLLPENTTAIYRCE